MTWIGVVDCNNFFVSCERLFRPDLQKKPVAVLSSNDGCIVARSQKIKDIGIPMGVPYFKVKDIIKDNKVTLFSSHFALYRDLSRRVFSVLKELLDDVEQYSVDEAFFSVAKNSDPELLAKRTKEIIERQVGIPVSLGIAKSKTQAKYAVELAKGGRGIKYLSQAEWFKQTESIKLSELWGVGLKSYRRYQAAGYSTAQDLIDADPARIKALFGVSGERLVAELKGKSGYALNAKQPDQKSMMSTRSFRENTKDIEVLEDSVAYHTRHIAADLRKNRLLASIIRVSIRPSKHNDFFLQGTSVEAVLDRPTNDTFTLLKVAQKLLKEAYKVGVPYRKAGVIAGGLISAEREQPTLFFEDKAENKRLLRVVDHLNLRADRELVTIGDRQLGDNWRAKKNMISPAYTTKWTDVAVVKA